MVMVMVVVVVILSLARGPDLAPEQHEVGFDGPALGRLDASVAEVLSDLVHPCVEDLAASRAGLLTPKCDGVVGGLGARRGGGKGGGGRAG